METSKIINYCITRTDNEYLYFDYYIHKSFNKLFTFGISLHIKKKCKKNNGWYNILKDDKE